MNPKLTALSQRYVTALRKHLQQGPQASLHPALALGRQAVTLGLETLELARIHERALTTLRLSSGRDGIIQRAQFFFTEANIPIEETHRAARQSKDHLNWMKKTLGQRTEELAARNRQVQRGVVRRKFMENSAGKNGKHHEKLLAESLQLQKRLRQLTHRALAAQEDERTKISHKLQDEIAQTLLGINVRLLTLKTAAKGKITNLTKEIASAQRLVVESVQSINRFARELDVPQLT